MLRLEISLDEGLERLKSRVQELGPQYDESDDLDSLASSSTMNALTSSARHTRTVRFGGASRQVEILQRKLSRMEIENMMLRQEVNELQSRLDDCDKNEGSQMLEEKKANDKDSAAIVLNEGNVFTLVRGAGQKLD